MPPPSFIVLMSPPDYPSAWLRPRSAASVSPGKITAPSTGPGRPTSGLRRNPPRGSTGYCLQADLRGVIGSLAASSALAAGSRKLPYRT